MHAQKKGKSSEAEGQVGELAPHAGLGIRTELNQGRYTVWLMEVDRHREEHFNVGAAELRALTPK